MSAKASKPLVTVAGVGSLYIGGCGQYTDGLHDDPTVKKNRPDMRKERMDNVYLCRYDGTDFVQWYGRKSDGYFHPSGEIMKLTAAGKRAILKTRNEAAERYRRTREGAAN